MIIVGEDTKLFLKGKTVLTNYLTVIDEDCCKVGIDANSVVLTEINVPDEEIVSCICFYMSNFPKDFNQQILLEIFKDHADLLEEVCTFVNVAVCPQEEIEVLIEDSDMSLRVDLFSRLAGL